MANSLKTKEFWLAAKFMSGSVLVIGGGSYLGFKLASYFPSDKHADDDPNLKRRGDGYAEYRIDEKNLIWITEREVDLRYQKIRLDNENLNLKERIQDLQKKIEYIKTRKVELPCTQQESIFPSRTK